MSALTPSARALLEQMKAAPRGPKREGLFALWLTIRVIEDLAQHPPHPDRAYRRRVGLLERRLSSLALPQPLRRGLGGTLQALRTAGRGDLSLLLSQLAAPVREGIGPEPADALLKAARDARIKK